LPTPILKNKSPDYSFLISASNSIGKFIKKNQLIIIESTINPGSTEHLIIPILEKKSGLSAGIDFFIAHAPERVNPGDPNWNIENTPRVIGAINQTSLKKTLSFYETIISAKIDSMNSIKEAEAVKILENCFRDINIAFINEMAISFSKLDINLPNVIRGASSKPFGFLAHYPGCGVGGHCIPVDPYYLINDAKNKGFTHNLLLAGRKINDNMPRFTVSLLIQAIREEKLLKKNIKVCLLGLTYKPNIQDVRESPSYSILEILEKEKIEVSIHDPYITNIKLNDAITGTQAIIIATAHDDYLSLNPEYLTSKGVKIVIDGRNCLNSIIFKKSKLNYKGIGC